MQNNKLMLISIVILTIGIMLSSFWLGYSIQKSTSTKDQEITVNTNVCNISQAANYLGMTEEEVKGIIRTEKIDLEITGSYTGMMFPYFKVDDEMYFYKELIDEWLKDITVNRREYDTINGYVF